VSFAGAASEGEGTAADISMGGCTFESNAVLAEGASLSLTLYLSNDHDPVIVDVAVVRSARLNQLGVEFLALQPNERERLQLFVHELWLGRNAAPSDTSDGSKALGDTDEESWYVPIHTVGEASPKPSAP
jgi:hypothetical protein